MRRGLLLFFALWYTVVVATNTTDLARVFGLLADDFPWRSDNYALLAGPTGPSTALTVVWCGCSTPLWAT
ncbi:MAG: hypothetical protein R3F61_29855 [Myxococcota bacterium]